MAHTSNLADVSHVAVTATLQISHQSTTCCTKRNPQQSTSCSWYDSQTTSTVCCISRHTALLSYKHHTNFAIWWSWFQMCGNHYQWCPAQQYKLYDFYAPVWYGLPVPLSQSTARKLNCCKYRLHLWYAHMLQLNDTDHRCSTNYWKVCSLLTAERHLRISAAKKQRHAQCRATT